MAENRADNGDGSRKEPSSLLHLQSIRRCLKNSIMPGTKFLFGIVPDIMI
ncbi:hypothetical protein SAMN05444373_101220 [Thermoclostridium caenicola]|uniref:Uncharacterized protein n=1 Tax=Thermoclostridium caenicola TaxID=659425 RepID=A0A1M6EGV9_9FIRM|nr:hypothetical protein SAMN05444373_101220 [Thermoclostridium caenicola]